MLYRVGNKGDPGAWTTDYDAEELANLACVGFFFIALVQVISTLLGDKSPVQVRISYKFHYAGLLILNSTYSNTVIFI